MSDGYLNKCKTCCKNFSKNNAIKLNYDSNTDSSITRTCSHCKKSLPATLDFFHKNRKNVLGVVHICITCQSKKLKNYYINNKEKMNKQSKEYAIKNSEKIKHAKMLNYQNNKEKIAAQCKKYSQENKESINKSRKKYLDNNKDAGLIARVRSRISTVIKQNRKSSSCLFLLGVSSLGDLKKHLESQFEAGMTWDNYGEWHIDHIIPCSLYDFSIEQNQFKCFNYRNMRPLWAKENLQKYNDLDIDLIRSHDIEDLLP